MGAEVERLREAARTIRTLCTDDVRTGLYMVSPGSSGLGYDCD